MKEILVGLIYLIGIPLSAVVFVWLSGTMGRIILNLLSPCSHIASEDLGETMIRGLHILFTLLAIVLLLLAAYIVGDSAISSIHD